MAKATRLPTASQNAAVDAVTARGDAGGPGTLEIRDGTQPTSANDAAVGTLLVAFAMDATGFGASASGTAAAAGLPKTATPTGTGTATWGRYVSGGSATVIDGSAGAGGVFDFVLNNASLSPAQDVDLLSWDISQPAS